MKRPLVVLLCLACVAVPLSGCATFTNEDGTLNPEAVASAALVAQQAFLLAHQGYQMWLDFEQQRHDLDEARFERERARREARMEELRLEAQRWMELLPPDVRQALNRQALEWLDRTVSQSEARAKALVEACPSPSLCPRTP